MTPQTAGTPFRSGPTAAVPSAQWRAFAAAPTLYSISAIARILGVFATVCALVSADQAGRPLRTGLAVVTVALLATGVTLLISCIRFARLPRTLGSAFAIPAIACGLAGLALDARALSLFSQYVLTRPQGEITVIAEQWSSLLFADSLVLAAQPLFLLVAVARVGEHLGDVVLMQRARVFAPFIPIAVIALAAMELEGYARPSILTPPALAMGGPFGIMGLAILATVVGLMLRLRGLLNQANLASLAADFATA